MIASLARAGTHDERICPAYEPKGAVQVQTTPPQDAAKTQAVVDAIARIIGTSITRSIWPSELQNKLEATADLAGALQGVEGSGIEFGGPDADIQLLLALRDFDLSGPRARDLYEALNLNPVFIKRVIGYSNLEYVVRRPLVRAQQAAQPLRARLDLLDHRSILYRGSEIVTGPRRAINPFSDEGTQAHKEARAVISRVLGREFGSPVRIDASEAQKLVSYLEAFGRGDAPAGFDLYDALEILAAHHRDLRNRLNRGDSPLGRAISVALSGIGRDRIRPGVRGGDVVYPASLAIALAFQFNLVVEPAWALLTSQLASDPTKTMHGLRALFAADAKEFGDPSAKGLAIALASADFITLQKDRWAAKQTLFVLYLAVAIKSSATERGTDAEARNAEALANVWRTAAAGVRAYWNQPRTALAQQENFNALSTAFEALIPDLRGNYPYLANAMRAVNARIAPDLAGARTPNWRDQHADLIAISALVETIYRGQSQPVTHALQALAGATARWPQQFDQP